MKSARIAYRDIFRGYKAYNKLENENMFGYIEATLLIAAIPTQNLMQSIYHFLANISSTVSLKNGNRIQIFRNGQFWEIDDINPLLVAK